MGSSLVRLYPVTGRLTHPIHHVHLTVSMVVFGITLIELWHTEFPVWAFFLALAIGTRS